jgi:molybdopterin converting factor small subunit
MFKYNLSKILKKYKTINNIVQIEDSDKEGVFFIRFINFKYKGGDSLLVCYQNKGIKVLLLDSVSNNYITTKNNFVRNVAKLIDRIVIMKNKAMLHDLNAKLKNENIVDVFAKVTDINSNYFLIKFKNINAIIKVYLNYIKLQHDLNNRSETEKDYSNSYIVMVSITNIIDNEKKIINSGDIIDEMFNLTNKHLNSFT